LLLLENVPASRALESRLPLPMSTMPILEFIDSTGVAWRVWNTVPSPRTTLSGEFERGWLTFESPTGALRRLAPVPPDWDSAHPEKLELMCRAASDVERRTGPFTENAAGADAS
jgi:hypothetical protein